MQARRILANARPAATMIVVAALLDPAWGIEIEMDAVIHDTDQHLIATA